MKVSGELQAAAVLPLSNVPPVPVLAGTLSI